MSLTGQSEPSTDPENTDGLSEPPRGGLSGCTLTCLPCSAAGCQLPRRGMSSGGQQDLQRPTEQPAC